jgi:hypothetical protein
LKVSDSKAAFKIVGSVVLALALCFAMVTGLAACGSNTTATTGGVTTTAVQSTDTTVGDTATSEAAGAVDAALVGKWHCAQTSQTLEFTSGGKMIITPDGSAALATEFPYKVEGANVVYGPVGLELTSPYSIAGDVLTIVNPDVGGPVTCDRVK